MHCVRKTTVNELYADADDFLLGGENRSWKRCRSEVMEMCVHYLSADSFSSPTSQDRFRSHKPSDIAPCKPTKPDRNFHMNRICPNPNSDAIPSVWKCGCCWKPFPQEELALSIKCCDCERKICYDSSLDSFRINSFDYCRRECESCLGIFCKLCATIDYSQRFERILCYDCYQRLT